MTTKEKVSEKLFKTLDYLNTKIIESDEREIILTSEAIENIVILIMGLEGVNLNEVWKSR